MCPAMCYMCSICYPPTKNFRMVHCFGLAYLLDLLHNPKCAGSLLSLNSNIYRSEKGVLIIPFSIRATKQNHAFSEVVPRGRPPKIPIFRPLSLVRMWLTPTPFGRPHITLDTALWSCSVKLVLRKYAAH